ncbi:hypothetical protein [Jiella sonneratiae]|uniref:Uncharacterized protein n=1 Tax=Jiella sonneratiae TaxID=2816856 RepID=A0ABS3IZI4_9HYPH|nr:hypothetical protein [Jiella sonneratiae]MBO0902814.1 hypothetical protein [Jiella sonneratiae]
MNEKIREKADRVFPNQNDRHEKGSAMTLIRQATEAQRAKSARLRAERIARDDEAGAAPAEPVKAKRAKTVRRGRS